MYDVLAGVRVIELAQFAMVPSAGALLADLGADVIKVEHPDGGDPYRAVKTASLGASAGAAVAQANRGKRSIGLDVKHGRGRDILLQLVDGADVFLTSWRTPALARLHLDDDTLRARDPGLVYARGTGFGDTGPEADSAGFDLTAFWSRGGVANALTRPSDRFPVELRPAFGDRSTAVALALAVTAAVVKRMRTGEGSTVSASLLGNAAWILANDLQAALDGGDPVPDEHRSSSRNPLTNAFRTRDDRWIVLSLLQPDRHWARLCDVIGRPDLVHDARFADARSRAQHRDECLAELDAAFATRDLAAWKDALVSFDGAWAPVQRASEVVEDPQVVANGWLTRIPGEDDRHPVTVVAAPVQVSGGDRTLARSPEAGEHTELLLLELGYTFDEILELKEAKCIV